MWYRKALTIFLLAGCIGLLAGSTFAFAQDEAATDDEAAVEAVAAESESVPIDYTDVNWDLGYTINTLIMFLTAVLVLFMQAGFAMVEVGLNSQKNAINILFKNLMDLCLGVILFLFLGYGLMYPGADYAGKWFGYAGPMVTRDAQGFDEDAGTYEAPPADMDGAPYAASSADFLFQVAFCATAATIVSGAVAGRLKFISYLIYTMVITGLVYPVSGMWKWGGGALADMGFQDFAGSVVVHAVGGFAGLAGALALGPRIGRYLPDGRSNPMPGHNITFAALGVFILWIGWYGFNPGSMLMYNGAVKAEATAYVALTTTLAAAAGAVGAMICSWAKFGKPDITMALNGCLAGLVGITANCDRVSELEALAIGAIAGLIVFLGIILLDKLKIDDPVGAVPVHGFCGVWGGLATGIFGDIPEGFENITSRMDFFIVQLKSTAIICGWAFGTMLLVFYGLKAIGMLRVSPEEEQRGLDIGEHGMEAYTLT